MSTKMVPVLRKNDGAKKTVHDHLRYTIGSSSLGAVLVAHNARGICAILIGDRPDPLADSLQEYFPQTSVIRADAELAEIQEQVLAFIEMPKADLDIPLDVRGTVFQQRVWEALRAIPAGKTATYSDIAERIGAPKAVRAVAHACATNRIAVAIPCHRAVRRDGTLAGYRWGLERKRMLLDLEALP